MSLNNKAQSSILVVLFMRKAVIKLRLIVESERIELSSKQAIKEPSTRLVFHCFFDCKLAKDNLLTT